MTRRMKVHILGKNGVAEKILKDAYNEPYGLLVADGKNEIIWGIGPNVEETTVIESPLGGG